MPKSRSALDGWHKKTLKTLYCSKLTFLHSILQLPNQAAPRQVLLACLSSSSPRSWINTLQCHLDALNLPDISILAANTPSASIWHRCIDRLIACQAQLNLTEEAESKKDVLHQAQCSSPTLESHTDNGCQLPPRLS